MNRKPTFKQRLQYWLDNRMSKGTISMIKILVLGTLGIILVFSLVIYALKASEQSNFLYVLWDNAAYAINAWLPFASDMDEPSVRFLLPATIVSIVGLLFTSMLVGLCASGIEERVSNLRKGNSLVLATDHIVVLGFTAGEYTLLSELIEAADGEKIQLLVAGDVSKDEMEDLIRTNVTIPKNAKIICRNIDICDPQALTCCAISQARAVVISPAADDSTIHSILAVLSVLDGNEESGIKIIASIKSDRYFLPQPMLEKQNILMLQTNDIIARLIARSCTQNGVAELFDGIFNFTGSEFYSDPVTGIAGKSFVEAVCGIDGAVPIGFIRNGSTIVNPPLETVIQENDRLIYFAEDRHSLKADFEDSGDVHILSEEPLPEEIQKIVVFGYNETFETFVNELPDSIHEITLVETTSGERRFSDSFLCGKRTIRVFDDDIENTDGIRQLLSETEHVFIFNNHDSAEAGDTENILLLLNLRNIKNQYGDTFTITAEMLSEKSRNLVTAKDSTDYIIASNISSMILSQMVESPELLEFYSEILSNQGNEIYLKDAAALRIHAGDYSIRSLRKKALACGYILLGYCQNHTFTMNPGLNEVLTVGDDMALAVIGEN